MSRAVIIVSDEGFGGVVPLAGKIRDASLRPILVTGRVAQARLDKWQTVYDDVRVVEDPYEVEVLEKEAEPYKSELAGLFSCYDGLVLPAAVAASRLGLPHPDLSGLIRSRNKYAMRVATREAGIYTPHFSLVSSLDSCDQAAAQVGFPAVLKPLNGMGSHLVRRVENIGALRSAYSDLAVGVTRTFVGNYSHPLPLEPGLNGPAVDTRKTFLLEEFVDGDEYSAEIVMRGGRPNRIALFHKFIVDPNGFLEEGFTVPATSDPAKEEKLWCHIEDCVAALGLNNGTAHVEIFHTSSSPVLVEVNAGRTGGGLLASAVRETTGVDLMAEILSLQVGEPRPNPSEPRIEGKVSVLTIFPPHSGRLDGVDGLDNLRRLPGVIEVLEYHAVGDMLEVEDKEEFGVDLLVSGLSDESLMDLHKQACELLHFRISQLEMSARTP